MNFWGCVDRWSLPAGDEVDDPDVGVVGDGAGGVFLAGDDFAVDFDDDVGKGVAEPLQQGGDGQPFLPLDLVAIVDQDHAVFLPRKPCRRGIGSA